LEARRLQAFATVYESVAQLFSWMPALALFFAPFSPLCYRVMTRRRHRTTSSHVCGKSVVFCRSAKPKIAAQIVQRVAVNVIDIHVFGCLHNEPMKQDLPTFNNAPNI
jgi:hypothetical protein